MATMLYEKAGDVLIVVHTEENPSDSEWTVWIQRMAKRDFDSILVVTAGGGPNSKQRAQAMEFWRTQASHGKFAAITDSGFVRGILTALQWFGFSDIMAFSSAQIDAALKYLSVPPSVHPAVLKIVTELQHNLGIVMR